MLCVGIAAGLENWRVICGSLTSPRQVKRIFYNGIHIFCIRRRTKRSGCNRPAESSFIELAFVSLYIINI